MCHTNSKSVIPNLQDNTHCRRHVCFDKKNTDSGNNNLSYGKHYTDIVGKRHIFFHRDYTFAYYNLNSYFDGKLKIDRHRDDLSTSHSLVLIGQYLNVSGILKISKLLLVFV